jgi:benzylsuccinate CoA-transferase BbsF subunit
MSASQCDMGHTDATGVRALDGVRVVELSIAIAAPSVARTLAFHGAEVLKIEARSNPDVARLFGSAWARVPEFLEVFTDTSPYVPEMSAGKLSVGLELKHPEALAALHRIIATADVFITNYSTPAVRGLGLGYDEVRAIKPDIVYVAMPGFGSDESLPYYPFLAWGPNQAPLVGMDELTGYADQEPAGVASIAPPDYLAGKHGMLGVLAALDHREATGDGVFVDLSQFETTVSLLGPHIFDFELAGNVVGRNGNRDPRQAPQGCYPCAGDDRWVAVTVGDDDAWAALGEVCDEPWVTDPRFATLDGRIAHHDEIDGLLGAWTAGHDAAEVAAWLQEAGVAAHPVLDHAGLLGDDQIRARAWYAVRGGGRFELDLFGREPLRLTETPGDVHRAGPSMGQDTRDVLTRLAGLDDAEIDMMIESGAAFAATAPDRVLQRPYHRYIDVITRVDRGGRA